MNELAEDSLETAKSAASAPERSATAADNQAQAALVENDLSATGNGLTVESQRARVTVRGVTLRQKPTPGQSLTADVYVDNAGHSEAVNVRVRMTAIRGRALPAGDMPSIPSPAGGSAGVLAPGGKMSSDLLIHATELTAQFVDLLLSGSLNLFVLGWSRTRRLGSAIRPIFCFVPNPTETQNSQTCSKWSMAR